MKERMKKVTALCLAAALSVGTVLPVHAETVGCTECSRSAAAAKGQCAGREDDC